LSEKIWDGFWLLSAAAGTLMEVETSSTTASLSSTTSTSEELSKEVIHVNISRTTAAASCLVLTNTFSTLLVIDASLSLIR